MKPRNTRKPFRDIPCIPWFNKPKKGNNMKLNIDWAGMLKAAVKAVWPFIAGAVGGIFSGCTVGGIGPNFL
jgi:hypothetical protein